MIFPMEIDNSDKLQIRRSMIQSSSSCILQLMRKVPELFFRKILMQLKADDIRALENTSKAMRKHYTTHFIWSKFLKVVLNENHEDTDWKYFFKSQKLLNKFQKNTGNTLEFEIANRKYVELFFRATSSQFQKLKDLKLTKFKSSSLAGIGSLKEMGISSVTFSSDEIAVGTKKGFVKIYENNKQMKPVETLKIYEGPVSAIQFLSDKHVLTCGASTNRRKNYDVFVTDRSTAADTKISTVSDAFFAAIEGNTLIQSTLSNVFLLNRFKSLESLKIGKFSNEIVTNASLETIESFDWNRKALAACSRSKISVVSLYTGDVQAKITYLPPDCAHLEKSDNWEPTLQFNENIFGLLPDLSVQIWDPRGQRLSRIAPVDDEPVRVMTTIGKTLFMGREDGSLLAYDTKDMKTSTKMQAHKGQLTVIGGNKFFMLTADDSGNLKKWDFYNITKAKKISKKRKRDDSESDSEWN